MLNKIIEFSAPEDYVNDEIQKDTFPTPVKLNIPDWYKKLKHVLGEGTAKGCMPFLDTLTTGYILKAPQDLRILHGQEIEKEGRIQKSSKQEASINNAGLPININYKDRNEIQYPNQVTGWPDLKNKNQGGVIHKIMNPWVIKTPPGYSCLLLPVLNNNPEKFEAVPGIVDTDTYNQEINFPILLSGFEKPPIDFIIKRGTPYVQIIPFKRESWRMKIKKINPDKSLWRTFLYHTKLFNIYKTFYWKKKDYK